MTTNRILNEEGNRNTDLTKPLKNMFIIGNAEVKEDLNDKINSADIVIRFNNVNNYNINTGIKTDYWILSSNKFLLNQHIKDGNKLGAKKDFSVQYMIENSLNIYFSIPPFFPMQNDFQGKIFNHLMSEDRKERIDSVHRFLEYFNCENISHRIIEFPNKYINDIAPEIWSPKWTCPSNGYLITRMFVDDATFYKYKKHLVGFTWEGWEGHPWILEKLYLEKMERECLITIIR